MSAPQADVQVPAVRSLELCFRPSASIAVDEVEVGRVSVLVQTEDE